MSEPWSLPGYDVQARIGGGATGELWRARELATGDVVDLRRLAAGAVLRADVELVRTLDTPYVVRLRAVVEHDHEVVLVLDHAPGGSLADLLTRRGCLEPGEVVTVAAPLARALAALHARGLVHGRLSSAAVLFTERGMPLLGDLWVGSDDGAGGPDRRTADEGADVRALADVCRQMLAGTAAAPDALLAAVEQGKHADPARRPDAAAFAAALRRAHPPVPVQLTGGPARAADAPFAQPARRPTSHRRRRSRGRLPAGALVLLVVLGAATGWLSGRGGDALPGTPVLPPVTSPAASPSSVASASPPDFATLLDDLDAARAEAFRRADAAALNAVYAPRSPGLAADRRLVQQLAAAGRSAHGVRDAVRAVDVEHAAGPSARLRVVDALGAYEVRDAAGAVVGRTPPRADAPHVVELALTPSGWRLVQVAPG